MSQLDLPSSETASVDRAPSEPAMLASIAGTGGGICKGYFGAKNGEGVWQTIINQIPPHETFIEAFAGSATITRLKRPATSTIVIESDAAVSRELKKLTLPGLTVVRGDAVKWLEKWIRQNPHAIWNRNSTCLYLDPPYLFDTRSGGRRKRYGHEFGEEWLHGSLLELFKYVGFNVLISHPVHPLYERMLKNWRRVDYRCSTRGGPRTESLWCNFDPPTELHDYRFAGQNFRERERIKRKRTRWQAKLLAMPELERSIIRDALQLASSGMASAAAIAGNGEPRGIVTPRSTANRSKSQTVVSVFPGADLLGRGFEQAGYCVTRGPDKLWGQDVSSWHLVSHTFAGLIGGSPCPGFCVGLRRGKRGDAHYQEGVKMLGEFSRLVTEAQPDWWLLENVPQVPDVAIEGYTVQRFNLNGKECGVKQHRLRCFQFGYREGEPLVIRRQSPSAAPSRCCLASEGKRKERRAWADFCELQGLPRDFDLPGLPIKTKYSLVGNGVPVPMARLIAEAIRDRGTHGPVRLCICNCGRPVEGHLAATAACRKRLQRRRDKAGVSGPEPVTASGSH